MHDDDRSSWSDDRLRSEFEKLANVPEEVARLKAEMLALRASHTEALQRSQRVTAAILAFVVPITLALIGGGVEIVLHIANQAPGH